MRYEAKSILGLECILCGLSQEYISRAKGEGTNMDIYISHVIQKPQQHYRCPLSSLKIQLILVSTEERKKDRQVARGKRKNPYLSMNRGGLGDAPHG